MTRLQDHLTQHLQLGKLESELTNAVLQHHPTPHGLCAYSGGNLPHGQESAHRRWIDDLQELQRNVVEMEVRAAQMKEELKGFLEQLQNEENAPDWEHPQERKRMSALLRPIYGKAHGALPGKAASFRSVKSRLPKLTEEVFHNMLVFHKGDIHPLSLNRVTHMEAETQMLALLAALWVDNPDESIDVSERPGVKHCRWLAVPKHVDGGKGYAVVRRFAKRWGKIWRAQEVWLRTREGWSLESR